MPSWGRLGQSLNTDALRSLWRLAGNPELMVPHISVRNISHLDFCAMRASGIVGVVLDKDNTLTAPYDMELSPAVAGAVAECVSVFGRNAVILSNSAGTEDDEGHAEAASIEHALQIPVIRHRRKKPACLDEVVEYFRATGALSESTGGSADTTALLCAIGDRILTDVVFGNMHGMFTVHTQAFARDGDNPVAAAVRKMENGLILPAVYALRGRGGARHPCFADHAALQQMLRTEVGPPRTSGVTWPPG